MSSNGLNAAGLGPLSWNTVLNGLAVDDRKFLTSSARLVDLQVGQVLELCEADIEHVYFPLSAIASVTIMQASRQVELGLIGREGMIGVGVLLGEPAAQNETRVQLGGSALRIGTADFRAVLAASTTLGPSLLRYVHAYIMQSARTTLANGYWNIEERLARHLLLIHDRLDGDRIALTHGSLADSLSVTRPGVTLALHILEERGVIRARRSEITVMNREELKKSARGSYGAVEERHRPAKMS